MIYDREHSAFTEINPGMICWEDVLKNAQWFHWTGITPAVSHGAALSCMEAVKVAKSMGITVSCDLNYRKKLWKYGKQASQVMPFLVEQCDVIIGNEEDAEMIFNIRPEGYCATAGKAIASDFDFVCRELSKRFPRARIIALTLRGSLSADHNTWSGILWDGKTMHTAPVYDITHIVDRVGGGDSFAGGLIYGLLTWPADHGKALRFATAASCLKHTIYGDFNRVTIQEVENLMEGDASGRVNR